MSTGFDMIDILSLLALFALLWRVVLSTWPNFDWLVLWDALRFLAGFPEAGWEDDDSEEGSSGGSVQGDNAPEPGGHQIPFRATENMTLIVSGRPRRSRGLSLTDEHFPAFRKLIHTGLFIATPACSFC